MRENYPLILVWTGLSYGGFVEHKFLTKDA